MLKLMNKILLILILMLAPLFAGAGINGAVFSVENSVQVQNNDIDLTIDEVIQNSTKEVKTPKVEDVKVMTPNANEEVRKDVLNDTNDNLKFTLKKFAYAMLGVVVSSLVIFLILTIMNKIYYANSLKFQRNEDDKSFIKDEIMFPQGENDALKIFFEKTR